MHMFKSYLPLVGCLSDISLVQSLRSVSGMPGANLYRSLPPLQSNISVAQLRGRSVMIT